MTLFFFLLFNFLLTQSLAPADHDDDHTTSTTIVFATLGRTSYAFDIYSLPIAAVPPNPVNELKLTDGNSVNFNCHFPSSSSSNILDSLLFNSNHTPPPLHLIYVTERNGSSSIYLDSVRTQLTRSQLCLAGCDRPVNSARISMKDKPSLVGENLIYEMQMTPIKDSYKVFPD